VLVTCTREHPRAGSSGVAFALAQHNSSALLRELETHEGVVAQRASGRSARQCLTEQKSLVLVSATWVFPIRRSNTNFIHIAAGSVLRSSKVARSSGVDQITHHCVLACPPDLELHWCLDAGLHIEALYRRSPCQACCRPAS